ncbi:MAG: SDR family NAD(P)-dependent oxidoreductase [Candidatus Cyclobacteriaceae bacterium M3_2C_046]
MKINLSKKNVLVTGASRGIGKAITRQLVACGAHVAIHYHKSDNAIHKLKDELGHNVVIFQANLCQPLEVIRLFIDVVKRFNHLDVLVNNAGVAIHSKPDGEDVQWVDDWSETMMINLNSAALLCKKAIEHFLEKGGGRIINISSRAAFRGDTADYLAYAASKGGMVALTKSIARAYGKKGIIAFDVAPGFVNTDMAQHFIKQYGEQHALNDISLNRLTEPEDLAPLIAFLASGMADHATGTTFDLNAGSYFH